MSVLDDPYAVAIDQIQARVKKLEALAERRRRGYMSAVGERNIAEAERDVLRVALREIASHGPTCDCGPERVYRIASAALQTAPIPPLDGTDHG